MTSELGLSVPSLLRGNWFNGDVSDYIRGAGDQLNLRPIVAPYGDAVSRLYTWMFSEFQAVHGAEIDEVNGLVAHFNAILTGAKVEGTEQPE